MTELIELERHNVGYGGKGRTSAICWPNGSVGHVPQSCQDLLRCLMLARLAHG